MLVVDVRRRNLSPGRVRKSVFYIERYIPYYFMKVYP